ncbi:ROK family protein [Bacilliculturomica massiliensis]|uniref:ROK family protein n=1 Tax=Bacilliculturomica massiliensis TaxID=1917867 RepID=UPI0013EF4241|nr:ROK family protein [Bacilliculturomica massiliensis]
MLNVGFDVGGTNIKVGVVNEKNQIVAQRRQPFPTGRSYQKVAAIMAEMTESMAEELSVPAASFGSVGIAIPGDLDAAGETIINAHNLHFHNIPMKREMEKHFPRTPVFLGNDANVAALAELHAGVFQGCRTAVLLTLGTGVGGGLILNGRMFNGGMEHGVELGHMILVHGGDRCSCGKKGCVEAYCAGTWLVRQGRKAIVEYPLSLIYKAARGSMERVSAKLVIDCAKKGDAVAQDIFDDYVEHLSSAITSIASLLDPEVIALGGGVSLAGDFLFRPLRRQVEEKSFFHFAHKVMPAKLGNEAGIIGAANLIRNQD